MKIAGVVILYNPDTSITQNILSYSEHIERLYIIDNSERKNELDILTRNPNVVYIHDGENKGIAIRLNQAADLALAEGFSLLLTMDQDSFFPEDHFKRYLSCVLNYRELPKVGMFGVTVSHDTFVSPDCTTSEVPHLITSGSIVNLEAYQKIGPFDEALFIDKVDHEYCLRAKMFSYKILSFHHIYLNHSLGTIRYGRSLKNFKKTPRVIHSPIRMYYILRNYFYLRKKYQGQFAENFSEMKAELLQRTKNNFLFGSDRMKLISLLLRGYADFKKNNMGKLKL